MSSSNVSLPGVRAPGVGFDQPFEMLDACHERVQRSLALLQRIVDHVDQHGHDDDSRSAAGDVLRYFDLAAPHHHDDEERHVFPPLLNHPDAEVRGAVAQLQRDHLRMGAQWARLRRVLLNWRDARPAPAIAPADRQLIEEFAAAYPPHIALEEALVYPAARTAVTAEQLARIGEEMAARRRA